MANRTVNVPGVGDVVLVDREQLRFTSHGRSFRLPRHLKGLVAAAPTPPPTFDHSKGEAIKYPILGNDRYGDCYYAAVAHAEQTYTGNAGVECSFDVNAVTRRYLQISGGDNGLGDQDVMPEWKAGIVGPNGPRKILDELTVDLADGAAQQLAAWAFGGLIWTAALPDRWLASAGPGVVWDADRPDPNNGHAMHLTGRNGAGTWDVRTWGLSPPVRVTPAGLQSADSELIVAFSLDQFRPDGLCAFTGMTYGQKADLWTSMGGHSLPPSPFGPTPPAPPPTPPAPPPPVPPWVTLLEEFLAWLRSRAG